jgi:anthranilate synthase/aminodeoxychorismate synthase-like glutamine amidotransferase
MTATAPRAGDGSRVFMIDNYDSFTYNLVQFLGELGADITVKRNDQVTIAEIEAAAPTHLVVSPGPCTPNEAGISMDAIAHFGAARLPVLGVCLGHQAIGQVYGGVVRRAGAPVHGKTDEIGHDGRGVFAGLPDPFTATRYHSLVVDEALPDCLALTAWNADGVVMGVGHRDLPVHGVQFHPESVLTEVGLDLLATFLRMTGAEGGGAAQAAAAHEEAGDAE